VKHALVSGAHSKKNGRITVSLLYLLQSIGDFIQRFVPGNPFKLAFAPLAHPA
jgi:hypothetical protein